MSPYEIELTEELIDMFCEQHPEKFSKNMESLQIRYDWSNEDLYTIIERINQYLTTEYK